MLSVILNIVKTVVVAPKDYITAILPRRSTSVKSSVELLQNFWQVPVIYTSQHGKEGPGLKISEFQFDDRIPSVVINKYVN